MLFEFSAVLLAIYTEMIVFGADFFSFLAFVTFIAFISSQLEQSVVEFIEASRKSHFEVLSKSKLEQASLLNERLAECELLIEASDLYSDIQIDSVATTYNFNENYYASIEHTLGVAVSTYLSSLQLNAVITAMFDVLAKTAKTLISNSTNVSVASSNLKKKSSSKK